MRILVSSKNQGKIKEIKSILSDHEILSLKDVDVDIDVVEDGDTFEANAVKKAKELSLVTGEIVLADDSGLCVDFLDGAPGVYSARYAGEDATDEDRNNKLLDVMKDVPLEERGAQFVSVVALYFPDGRVITREGVCEGYITYEPKGDNGFGYDPVFLVRELNKTYSEITDDEKNLISHRGKALELLKLDLEKADC